MDKLTAVLNLIAEGQTSKITPSQVKRAAKSCRALGLTDDESLSVAARLELMAPANLAMFKEAL